MVNIQHKFRGFNCDATFYNNKRFHIIDVRWVVGCLATAIGVDSLPSGVWNLLESQLLDQVDDRGITYYFGIPDSHK